MYVKIPDSMKTLDSPAERSNAHQLFKSQSAHGSVSVTSLVNPFVSSEMCHVLGYETSPDLLVTITHVPLSVSIYSHFTHRYLVLVGGI